MDVNSASLLGFGEILDLRLVLEIALRPNDWTRMFNELSGGLHSCLGEARCSGFAIPGFKSEWNAISRTRVERGPCRTFEVLPSHLRYSSLTFTFLQAFSRMSYVL